jgi:histone H3/H4
MFITKEDRNIATAEFEPGSPLYFFCQSKEEYDGVLAQQKELCAADGCQKVLTRNSLWCQEHEAKKLAEVAEKRSKKARSFGGAAMAKDEAPALEAFMHVDSLTLITRMQRSVERVLPFKVVAAMVMGLRDDSQADLQFEPAGICIFSHVLENHLMSLLEDATWCTLNAQRLCVMAKDVHTAMNIRKEPDPSF